MPLALSAETLRVWLADRGVDVGTIGLVSLASLPYTLKFLWAPVVDALPVPWLSAALGRRRGWLVASQLALMAAILFLGTRDPLAAPLAVGLGAGWARDPAQSPLLLFAVLMAGMIVFKHRSNIARLRAGSENRFAKRA